MAERIGEAGGSGVRGVVEHYTGYAQELASGITGSILDAILERVHQRAGRSEPAGHDAPEGVEPQNDQSNQGA